MGLRIKQLPPTVANQIAAGEVIERPASVVKELLENAYDAAADQVLIEIGHGGLNQIKISDNGKGIVEDDLPLAIAPHATSKISLLNDLYSISSMGFRGEALASIASVARLSISSKTKEQPHAMMLKAADGRFELSPCARNEGTTMDVRDLFYNVPVRKRFLKNERLEFMAIEAVVRRFAMSAPQIAIHLKHNGKTILDLPSARQKSSEYKRLTRLFGQAFSKDAVYLEVERSGMQLRGWLSGPMSQRSQNDRQWVYVNQRMVKDKLILHAIKQVYEGRLHPGRFPSCLLYFKLPPSEVDVNVHPTKHELRFQQPRLVHDFLSSQLTLALDSNSASPPPPALEEEIKSAPLELRERSPIEGLKGSKAPYPIQDGVWLSLNKSYALITFGSLPQLVNVTLLYREWLANQLALEPRPLRSRRLLIPLSYELSAEVIERIRQHQTLLSELGLVLEFSEPSALTVEAIPVLMPQLDFKAFLQDINNGDIEKALLESQTIDAQQLSQDERLELMYFMQTLQAARLSGLKLSKSLTEEDCQVMLNV